MERENSVTKDVRYKQADKEALFSLGAFVLYFVWWYVCAYGLGGGDPAQYSYVFGLPAWFFYSCIVGYPLITLILWIMVRCVFKNMPLGDMDDTDDADGATHLVDAESEPRAERLKERV